MRAEVFCFWAMFFEVENDCEAGRASEAEEWRRAWGGRGFRAKLRPGCGCKWIREYGPVLARVKSQGRVAKQSLKRPAAGEVNVNAASRLTDAGADFEQLGTQSFDLCRTPRLGQLLTEEVDQVVGGGLQQQAEGVGQEAMATQTVGAKAILELLDAVLAFPTVIVESEDLGGRPGAVGNHEAQVGSGGGGFGFVADAAQARPAAGAMAEAGKTALRQLRAAIATFQLLLSRLGALLEDAVGGDADGVLDLEELAEFIEHGQSEAGIAAQPDLHAGKGGLQSRHQAQEHGQDTGMTGGVSRTQPRCQQASGVALENQHGVIHVLAVGAVEKTELLLAVGGIVGGVEVEQNLAALADLIAAETDELLAPSVVEAHQIAARGRVLPAAERRLRAQSLAQFLIGDDLQQRIVAQTVGVVGVFVSCDALLNTF